MRKNQKATRYGIALSTLLMTSSLMAAMDAPVDTPTKSLSSVENTNLAFLQDSLFIEELFKKCAEKGYEFIHEEKIEIPMDPLSMAEKEDNLKMIIERKANVQNLGELMEWRDELKSCIETKKYTIIHTVPMDPLFIFLGCLFSQEHEDKAFALLRQNPD